MYRILLTMCTLMLHQALFAQPSADNKSTKDLSEKIIISVSLYSDSAALAAAVPGIARQVVGGLDKKKKSYFKDLAIMSILTGEYKQALDAIDSVERITAQANWRPYYKFYTKAKLKDGSEGPLFRQTFQKELETAYKKMSFDQKVEVGGIDSIYMTEMNKGYQSMLADMKKNNPDTISMEDAVGFLKNYSEHMILNKIRPLALPYVSDPKYQVSFPVFKSNNWGGVYPVGDIDEVPDPNMQYKFVMELTSFGMPKEPDSVTSKDMNLALRSVSRTINLHVGAGIPKKNIDVVLAVHGSALNAFLNNEQYKIKYGIDNPNLPILKEFQDFGVKIILCGQAMFFQSLQKEKFIPGVKVALTAQTVISYYQLKNYVFSDLVLED